MTHSTRVTLSTATLAIATLGVAGVLALPGAQATVEPGTPGPDVHLGLDNDNARNTFIQPAGVTIPQHMDDADLLFGRGQNDLLFGRQGNDTLLGGSGSDILVGGPDGRRPGSDTLVGDLGNDVSIWSPGDGDDVFAADEGVDTAVFGPLVLTPGGSPLITTAHGRKVPRVDLGGHPDQGCVIVAVPPSEQLGVQYLVRFTVGGAVVATMRLKDVERVVCPSVTSGEAQVADLTSAVPRFSSVALTSLTGVVGDIAAPVG